MEYSLLALLLFSGVLVCIFAILWRKIRRKTSASRGGDSEFDGNDGGVEDHAVLRRKTSASREDDCGFDSGDGGDDGGWGD